MEPRTQNAAPVPTTIGVDIGKDVFHIVGFDAGGKIALRRKITRLALAETFKKLPPCVVGMEACLSAHFVSRTLRALGHQPRIKPREKNVGPTPQVTRSASPLSPSCRMTASGLHCEGALLHLWSARGAEARGIL
jgi:hypothetical protein